MKTYKNNSFEKLNKNYIQRIEKRYGPVIERNDGDILVYNSNKDGPESLIPLYSSCGYSRD